MLRTRVTLNEGNGWEATVSDLPKYADGEEIAYTWTESGLPEGYELTSNTTQGTVTTLTNSYTPETTSATVKKVWNDENNKYGTRPNSLTVSLMNGNDKVTEVTLSESNQWTQKVEDLPKYAGGQPISYTWTEDEASLPEGYVLSGNTTEGTVTTLTNTKYAPTSVKFTGTKTLEGRKLDAKEFSFNLSGDAEETVKNAADGSITFSEITYHDEGTYTYKIVEDTTSLPAHVTDNEEEYNVTVTVTRGDDYKLTAAISGDLASDGSGANFVNVYKPESTSITIAGNKTVTNYKALKGGEFDFTISGSGKGVEEAEATPTEGETADETTDNTNADAEKAEAAVEEAKAEVAEAEAAVEEAKKAVEAADEETAEEAKAGLEAADEETAEEAKAGLEAAEASAEEANAKLEKAEASAEEANAKLEKAEAATEEANAEAAPIVKAVTDAAKKVKDIDPFPEGYVKTVSNDADGNVSFADITFEEAGTYTFTIAEEAKHPAGVTNDPNSTREFTVKVVDNNGQLEATPNVLNFSFENSYKPTPAESEVSVKKILEGHTMKGGEFTFELIEDKEDGKTVATATNDADGTVKFSGIKFDTAGTFNYRVREVAGSSKAIKYDGNTYTGITAKVTDNYDGEPMTVEWSGAEGIKFTNTWDDKVFIDPPVTKVVVGPADKNEVYSFQLKAENASNPMPKAAGGASTMTLNIQGAGTKEFGNIYFTEPGEYSYQVTEVKGSNPNCQYDGSVYRVTAVVTEDPDTYELSVKSVYEKNGQKVDTATFQFVNTYADIPEEDDDNEPGTGDTNDIAGLLGLMGTSAAGLMYMFFRRRREDCL